MLLAATGILLTACDRGMDDMPLSGQQQPGNDGSGDGTGGLCIVAAKQPFTDETGTRAITDFDGTYTTTFENGDQIGVITVKDGAVLADCNNLKLTYNAAKDQWESDKPVYFEDGATYIAYYPYQSKMDGKKSAQEIYDAFTVSTTQYWEDYFAKNDLMIADNGTVNKTAKTLSFAFEHKMALLEISRAYYGRTTDGWAYPFIKNIEISSIIIGSVTNIYPFTDEADYSKPYRLYVKPEAGAQVSIRYAYKFLTGGNLLSSYTWNAPSGLTFVEGQRRKIIPSKTRNLEVGDYYYSDGSIAPARTIAGINYDGSPLKCPGKDEGCIGVVFATADDAIGDAIGQYTGSGLTGAIHGYVAALDDAKEGAQMEWGYMLTKTSTDDLDFVGYANTKKIQAASGYDDLTFPACWYATHYAASVPGNTSGWYLPSVGQLQAIYDNLVKGKGTAFSDVGGAEYKKSWYFSSSEYPPGPNSVCCTLGFANGSKSNGNKSIKSYVRSCFTF